ncbi:UPF0687 protein C20orf27 homolog, partial [Meleagris gallopavo]|uniref:UPF0687 protein C20orf27 homolog n=1 Tax=Meleagris gallopavo TaxID=9103 RepID=UPI00093D83A7
MRSGSARCAVLMGRGSVALPRWHPGLVGLLAVPEPWVEQNRTAPSGSALPLEQGVQLALQLGFVRCSARFALWGRLLWSFPEQSLERGPPCAIRARGGGWHVGALLEEPFSRPHAGSKAKAGAVRFAPSQPGEGNPGHVHFDEKLRDSAVMVTQERDGHVLVKVGFLKILHKYEITFLLPPSQRLGRDVCALPLPNPNLKVLGVTAVPEGYSVRCEYTAHKEGVLKEEMLLASETG